MNSEAVSERVLAWLLHGDPAIPWQTKRDLLDTPLDEVDAERAGRNDRMGGAIARPSGPLRYLAEWSVQSEVDLDHLHAAPRATLRIDT